MSWKSSYCLFLYAYTLLCFTEIATSLSLLTLHVICFKFKLFLIFCLINSKVVSNYTILNVSAFDHIKSVVHLFI